MTTSIVVDNVSKTFRYQYNRTLKQMLRPDRRKRDAEPDEPRPSDTFKALDGVSFEVTQGESIGLMGLNGSGKSTLLKLVSGVMVPDGGQVLTRGRISGLIATGAGFHNELSGRDNIYMNAAMLGMSKEEIDSKFDDIAAFADVGRQLDMPVGNYSSGQFARLGFAVAVHVDCDIFIADEVLAVGDRPFKRKCLKRMKEIRESGITMFYVSHSAGSVQKMCDRAIVLDRGKVGFDGDVDEAIKYLHYDDGDEDGDEDDVDERDEALASDI
ncbi:ABC-2 type transport system ATP-binding protein [Nocardioides exalbidus]|uniref:ABC-2 type transport system ATP-binding protein n=1 Tax=Nocardioides exalbidus TaxID=402596 RepID=A0A1H4U9T2_9ACTN|nr:ABC transporter ATP-binding protein [Nocardioides exalbidus]SEC65071.1 ABC-2 type transport system ATP-binding protein [Nocardioides exalbidus]